jgi:TetR/AcrR family transcriptional repressor of nem operon
MLGAVRGRQGAGQPADPADGRRRGPCVPDVGERTQAAFGVTRDALQDLLQRGCRAGQLRADLDVPATADTLFTLVLGLRVRARAGHTAAELATVIDAAVRGLQ